MERFIRQDAEFQRLYNCSFYNVSDIPREQRINVPMGALIFSVALTEELLYVLCMFAIWRHLEHSCYKIMFCMGVFDMLNLFVFCMGDGVLAMLGAVYCSAPVLLYMKGLLVMTLWLTETSIEVILALNRCLSFVAPHLEVRLFGSVEQKTAYRTWLWMIPPVLWGLNYFVREPPAIFSSFTYMEEWNPHLGYKNEMTNDYQFEIYDAHNLFIALALPLIYTLFAMTLACQYHKFFGSSGPTTLGRQQTWSQKKIFIQVAIIGAVNFLTTSIATATEMNWISYDDDGTVAYYIFSIVLIFLYMQAHGQNGPQLLECGLSRWNFRVEFTIHIRFHTRLHTFPNSNPHSNNPPAGDHFVMSRFICLPPVLYLTLNETLRNDCRVLMTKLICFESNHSTKPAGQLVVHRMPRMKSAVNVAVIGGTSTEERIGMFTLLRQPSLSPAAAAGLAGNALFQHL